MDDVGKLVLLHEVVDLGSFSAAARRRGLTHSTVSKHIQSLEAELGVRLLHRTSRSMSLTEEGRLAVEASRRIGGEVRQLADRLAERSGALRGTLRVSSLVHVGQHIVQPAIARLLADHPELRVELTLDDGPLAFSRGGFDVAVRVGLDAEAGLTARKLVDNEVCIVAAPGLRDRLPPLVHPQDLAEQPTVAYRAGPVDITTWRYLDGDEVQAVEVRPRLVVGDGNALLQAALDGIGIAYLSRFAAEAALADGRLVGLLPGVRLPPYAPVYALFAAGSRPARVDALLHALSTPAR